MLLRTCVSSFSSIGCSKFKVLVAAPAALLLPPMAVSAQELELPAVYVEGATLEAEPAKKKTKGSAVRQGQPTAPAAGGAGEGESGGVGEGVPLDEIGSAVTVITGKQLQEQQIRHAADALRSLPGVSVSQTGGVGNLTQVRIRGQEADHTLVLIDGVEANDVTSGEFDFSDLSAEDIERIEVIRGPQSGLYGSGAVGGVINIITKGGRGPLTFTALAEGGSFATKNLAGRVSAGNERGHFLLGYSRFTTEGFNIAPEGNEDDGSTLSTFNFKAGLQAFEGFNVDLVVRNSRNIGDYDEFGGNPGRFMTAFDAANTFDHNVWLTAATARWDMLDGALTHVMRATRNETERTDKSPGSVGHNIGEETKLSYAATYRLSTPGSLGASHVLTGLVESDDQAFTPLSDFGFFGAADGVERSRSATAGAVEYRGTFAERLDVTGTVRRDDNATFEDFTTWRTTASLRLPEQGLRPHASYGTGVRLPTMFENFGSIPGMFKPNPDLGPERVKGWDAGVEVTLMPRAWTLDVTYFKSDLTDKINGFAFDPSSGLFTAVNLPGLSKRNGIEVASRIALMRDVSLGLAYTYLDARDPDGAEEIRRPPHSGRADLRYLFDGGRGTFDIAAIYNGEMVDTAYEQVLPYGSATVPLDDYLLVNVAASYQMTPGVEFFGRIKNLLDENYQESFGYETAGIAAFAGVRFSYVEQASVGWAGGK
jgi:vitamin B12 transporter